MPDMNYEVRISGLVREDILQECGDVSVTTTDASTVLSGSVTDQAALLGLPIEKNLGITAAIIIAGAEKQNGLQASHRQIGG